MSRRFVGVGTPDDVGVGEEDELRSFEVRMGEGGGPWEDLAGVSKPGRDRIVLVRDFLCIRSMMGVFARFVTATAEPSPLSPPPFDPSPLSSSPTGVSFLRL